MTQTTMAEETPEAVAERTRELIKKQGWCLWECGALDGEIITVVRDEPPLTEREKEKLSAQLDALKERHPDKAAGVSYSISELEALGDGENVWLIHEAKREGAVIENNARRSR